MRLKLGFVFQRSLYRCVEFGLALKAFRRTVSVGGHQQIQRNGARIDGSFGVVPA